jgi:hypothetical protein
MLWKHSITESLAAFSNSWIFTFFFLFNKR